LPRSGFPEDFFGAERDSTATSCAGRPATAGTISGPEAPTPPSAEGQLPPSCPALPTGGAARWPSVSWIQAARPDPLDASPGCLDAKSPGASGPVLRDRSYLRLTDCSTTAPNAGFRTRGTFRRTHEDSTRTPHIPFDPPRRYQSLMLPVVYNGRSPSAGASDSTSLVGYRLILAIAVSSGVLARSA
jgi:hypothetical protein